MLQAIRAPARLILVAGSLLILLILALAAGLAVRRYGAELNDAARELRTLDLVLAAESARSFQAVTLVLDTVADELATEGGADPASLATLAGTRAVHDRLRARAGVVPQIDAVTIVGADGKLLNFSRSWPIPDVDLSDRDYFRALRDGRDKLFLSEPVTNRGTGTPTIYLARRLSAPDGGFLGLALGAIQLASFEQLYASLHLAPSDAVTLWRNDGVLLARYPALGAGQRLPRSAIAPTGRRWHGVEGVFETSVALDGEPIETRVIASQPTSGFPVLVNVGRNKAAILADWRRDMTEIGTAVVLAILSIVWVMLLLRRRFGAYEALALANRDRAQAELARQRAEAEREAAESANRAKSAFLANMSHELRTPLSAVIGYAEMMEEEAEEMGEDAFLKDLGKIKSNARHLLGLINDVLDLSKVEANKMDVVPERFDVTAFARDAAATVEALVAKKENRLVLDLAPDLGEADTDVTKLRQCLFNLISNAAKFTEGGTITLSARREPGPEGDRIALAVADTGIGMTPEQIGRLFQRFSQADETTTRRFGGTGLGLALSRAFAQLMGGDIAVESVEGRGTTFTLRVPATLPRGTAPVVPDAPAAAPEGGARDLVLVIDDEAAQRELMTRFLERQGFAVRAAGDGRAGLDLARTLRPRVILLDVMMPEMDGWSVLRALKDDPDLAGIPVVMVSFVADASLGASLGALGTVPKPVDWGRLKGILEPLRAQGGHVLVVDDDPDMRARLRTTLDREGWAVREAGNGVEALDAVRDTIPAVILLDLTMPVMDGFGFLHRLRAMPGCAEVPVIVLSARDVSAAERRALAEADQVLRKDETSLRELAAGLRHVEPHRERGAIPEAETPRP